MEWNYRQRVSNVNCCVFGCRSKRGRDSTISFHNFPPKDKWSVLMENINGVKEKVDKRKAWLKILKMKEPLYNRATVCSLHFSKEDYRLHDIPLMKRRLKTNAVPSLNLPFPSYTSSVNRNEKTRHLQKSNDVVQDSSVPNSFETNCDLDTEKYTLQKSNDVVQDSSVPDSFETNCDLDTEKYTLQKSNDVVQDSSVPDSFETNCDLDTEKYTLQKSNDVVQDSSVPDSFETKCDMDTEKYTNTDPLEITAADGLSLFGDSTGNIEFVIESDEDPGEKLVGTKKNPFLIQIANLKEIENQPVIIGITNDPIEVIDLDVSDVEEIKDEIEIEEAVLQTPPPELNEIELVENPAEDTSKRKQSLVKPSSDLKVKNDRCYVPNCTIDIKEQDKILWFTVPVDKNAKKIWDICIDRPDKRLLSDDIICSQHFADSDVVYNISHKNGVVLNATLKEGAVPCIKFHERCCVPFCESTTGPMFCFPVLRTSNFHLWLYMIRNSDLKKLKMKEVLRYRVCTKHFESDCFENAFTLKSTAAPTLCLPDMGGASVCSVAQCSSKSKKPNPDGKKITFFTYPKRLNVSKEWVRKCRRKDKWTPMNKKKNTKHFPSTDFEDELQAKKDDLSLNSLDMEPVPEELLQAVGEAESKLHCAYAGCKNTNNSTKLFRFPQNPNRCIAWLMACKRQGLISTPTATVKKMSAGQLGVCTVHFEPHQFESETVLKVDATPTRKSEACSEAVKISASTRSEFPVKRERKNYSKDTVHPKQPSAFSGICLYRDCCCKVSDSNPFFSFPVDAKRSETWLRACGMFMSSPVLRYQILKYQRICSKHFTSDMFESKFKLKGDAVPMFFKKSSAPEEVNEGKEETTIDEENQSSSKEKQQSSSEEKQSSSKEKQCSSKENQSSSEEKQSSSKEKQSSSEEKQSSSKETKKTKFSQGVKFDPTKIIYCAVSTCPSNYGMMHGKGRFPDPLVDRERFDIWLKLVDNPALQIWSAQDIYERFMICLKHFNHYFYMKDGKVDVLSKEAVPTKYLTADLKWFLTSDYYKNRLEKYLNETGNGPLQLGEPQKKTVPQKAERCLDVDSTICILEEDGIRFPKTGHYMHVEKRADSKRKFPYDLYKFSKAGYGLDNDINVGEHIRIHAAIIIDDDDECERRVLQQLLDKKRKH